MIKGQAGFRRTDMKRDKMSAFDIHSDIHDIEEGGHTDINNIYFYSITVVINHIIKRL